MGYKTVYVEDRKGRGEQGKFTPELFEKAKTYIKSCVDQYDDIEKRLKVNLPKITGLASFLGVSKAVLYEWAEKFPDFKKIMEDVISAQNSALVDKGLSGAYNPTIAKLLLHSHGYKESSEVDHTTGGDKITPQGHEHVKDILAQAEAQLRKAKMEA